MSLQFPSSPSTGQTFPAPLVPGQPSWVWDGAKWTSRGLANAMVATSPLPPLNPRVGDLWFDPVEGNTYVYFDDGNSQQWVVTINQTTSFANLPYASAALAASIGVPTGVWTDVLTLNVGNAGIWFVAATATCSNTSSATTFVARIWDGTTITADAVASGALSFAVAIAVSGVIINPIGSIRLSVAPTIQAGGSVLADTMSGYVSGGSTNQTHITAVRIG